MELKQNDREYLIDMVQLGKMTIEEANVAKVLMQRVFLVPCKIPKDVRKVLNEEVKRKKLGHMKKKATNQKFITIQILGIWLFQNAINMRQIFLLPR